MNWRSYRKKETLLGMWLCVWISTPSRADDTYREHDLKAYQEKLAAVHDFRIASEKRLRASRDPAEKRRIRDEVKQFVVRAIVHDIIPGWLGMPWTMAIINDGLKPDAAFPFETGKGISCSWFVVSVLRNAGLRFVNPRDFAGAVSIHIQHSLSPRQTGFKRFFSISPSTLKRKMQALGDGLYLIGLNCHIGFVYVEGERVEILHASYTAPQEVVIEPIDESAAVSNSERAGYVLSRLFSDDYLVDYWLSATKVPFLRWTSKGRQAARFGTAEQSVSSSTAAKSSVSSYRSETR